MAATRTAGVCGESVLVVADAWLVTLAVDDVGSVSNTSCASSTASAMERGLLPGRSDAEIDVALRTTGDLVRGRVTGDRGKGFGDVVLLTDLFVRCPLRLERLRRENDVFGMVGYSDLKWCYVRKI